MGISEYSKTSRSEKEITYISHTQCRLFRLAQKKWDKTPEETISLFQQYGLFGHIADHCDYFLLNGCRSALSLLEILLKKEGIDELTVPNNEVCDPNEDCAITTMRYMLQEYAQGPAGSAVFCTSRRRRWRRGLLQGA